MHPVGTVKGQVTQEHSLQYCKVKHKTKPESPLIEECLNILWPIMSMEYFATIKIFKNELIPFID